MATVIVVTARIVAQAQGPEPAEGEVTEQIDYEPARFLCRRIVRPTYVRRDHPFAASITAPLHTLQDRCIAAPRLLAQIIVAKYWVFRI